jgi:hypothetical protein
MRGIGLAKGYKGTVVFLEVEVHTKGIGTDYLIINESLNEGRVRILGYLGKR